MGDEKKINRQFKNNFNGILNRDKTISLTGYTRYFTMKSLILAQDER